MTKITTTNDNLTSRVIPGLMSDYRIVSLPYWAWFWLDDFMRQNRISYQGIWESFNGTGDVNDVLRGIAELHQDHCMRGVHNLANDNSIIFINKDSLHRLQKKKKLHNYNLPKIYKLFGFVPCATTLEAIWSRKNYNFLRCYG